MSFERTHSNRLLKCTRRCNSHLGVTKTFSQKLTTLQMGLAFTLFVLTVFGAKCTHFRPIWENTVETCNMEKYETNMTLVSSDITINRFNYTNNKKCNIYTHKANMTNSILRFNHFDGYPWCEVAGCTKTPENPCWYFQLKIISYNNNTINNFERSWKLKLWSYEFHGKEPITDVIYTHTTFNESTNLLYMNCICKSLHINYIVCRKTSTEKMDKTKI